MQLDEIELRRIRLPLVTPFRSSQSVETTRELLLVRVSGPKAEGWGECAALSTPEYSSETVDTAYEALKDSLTPLIDPRATNITALLEILATVPGQPMAKAALEMAFLDAHLRERQQSLADHLDAQRSRVPAGVVVGVMDSIQDLVDTVADFVGQGYRRVKLKIRPGWDVIPVAAVRQDFPDLPLQVDANMAYSDSETSHLAELDEFGLLMIEQPLARDDLDGHARLAGNLETPLCLDESLTSVEAAAEAVERGACSIINIKPGRIGGLTEAVRLHDFCLEHSIPAWCGGMLESGIGRAANLALAALPGFTLVGDLSASNRYFNQDITPPFELREGQLDVPAGPGIGVRPIAEVMNRSTVSSEVIGLPST